MMHYKTKRSALEHLITSEDRVLDIGFYGQAKLSNDVDWPHRIILEHAKDVYGIDMIPYTPEAPSRQSHYSVQSAEAFHIDHSFNVITAADLIEHLPNPGLFLDCCKKHLTKDGKLILTTPNAFNFYSIIEKITHDEPRVNTDHTCYFNKTTLKQLFQKVGWTIVDIGYIESIGLDKQQNVKRKILRTIYKLIGKMTPKFSETLIIIAKPI